MRIPVERPRGEVAGGATPCSDASIVAGYVRDASGRVGHAEALYRPQCEADVAAVLARAQREGAAVTVVAGQTSTTASSVPQGGWVLSMEKLARQHAAEPSTRTARCEAGANLGAFQDRLLEQGWLYPPDPTSRYECTLGGSIACNASGPRSHRFGATRSWIRALRVVLACGEVLALRRGQAVASHAEGFEIQHANDPACCAWASGGKPRTTRIAAPRFAIPQDVKNASGYFGGSEVDLIDLFVGSEGTLGVVTEVEVALVPEPVDCLNLLACFPDEASALDLVERAREASREAKPIRADSLEWFDRASLELIEHALPEFACPPAAGAAVFIEQLMDEVEAQHATSKLEAWSALLQSTGALVDAPGGVRVAQTASQREALRRARHAVPVGVNERAARNGMPKLGTDFAVADAHLRTVVALYHEAAARPLEFLGADGRRALPPNAGYPANLEAVTFGHVGDNHLHMNFLPGSGAARVLSEHVYAELTRRVIALGGTPSAEHGIGKIKRAALRQRLGDVGYAEMLQLKRALDPNGSLGRGNLFDECETAG